MIHSRTCKGCGTVQRWDASQPFDPSVYFESKDWVCGSCKDAETVRAMVEATKVAE